MSSVLLSSKKTIMSEKVGPFGFRYRQEPAPIAPSEPVLIEEAKLQSLEDNVCSVFSVSFSRTLFLDMAIVDFNG
jgi:hypothetical protein